MNRTVARLAMLLSFACVALAQDTELAHTEAEFGFTLDVPYDTAAPLFGADAEQKWSPDWKPQFIYPRTPKDAQGSVFRVEHGGQSSTWINTIFDLADGHVQYVYVISDAMITLIDIHLAKAGPERTTVKVTYERTAMNPSANEHVRHLGAADAKHGSEWKAAIEGYAAAQRTSPR